MKSHSDTNKLTEREPRSVSCNYCFLSEGSGSFEGSFSLPSEGAVWHQAKRWEHSKYNVHLNWDSLFSVAVNPAASPNWPLVNCPFTEGNRYGIKTRTIPLPIEVVLESSCWSKQCSYDLFWRTHLTFATCRQLTLTSFRISVCVVLGNHIKSPMRAAWNAHTWIMNLHASSVTYCIVSGSAEQRGRSHYVLHRVPPRWNVSLATVSFLNLCLQRLKKNRQITERLIC